MVVLNAGEFVFYIGGTGYSSLVCKVLYVAVLDRKPGVNVDPYVVANGASGNTGHGTAVAEGEAKGFRQLTELADGRYVLRRTVDRDGHDIGLAFVFFGVEAFVGSVAVASLPLDGDAEVVAPDGPGCPDTEPL